MAERHQVLVVGGGFGGLSVTKALANADVDVTIVDRTNHHLFQPLLYQVATGMILSEGVIAPPLRGVIENQANARAVLAEVTRFDLDARTAHDEWAALAPSMKTLEDAHDVPEPRRTQPPATQAGLTVSDGVAA